MYQFKDGDRVCFFGDSITHAGFFIRRIYDYYRNTLGVKLEMYNSGVSGNHAFHAIARMEKSLLNFEPTHVVMNFGMNDCGMWLYDGRKVDDECIRQRREQIDGCLKNLKTIADTLTEKGINVVFCAPTIYDELTESDNFCLEGHQAGLKEFGDRVKVLAENYGGNVIDFNKPMLALNKKLFKEGKTLINDDRIHPSLCGHEFMAQIFLKEQGFEISLAETLEELEEIANKPYDEWETRRFDLEQESKASEWVDLCMFHNLTEEEILKKLPDLLSQEKNPFIINSCNNYIEKRHMRPAWREELIIHTKTALKG